MYIHVYDLFVKWIASAEKVIYRWFDSLLPGYIQNTYISTF